MRSRLLAIALFAAGCTPDLCARHSDCAAGLVCTTTGQCALPPADAGVDGTTDGSAATGRDAGADAPPDSGGPVIEGRAR